MSTDIHLAPQWGSAGGRGDTEHRGPGCRGQGCSPSLDSGTGGDHPLTLAVPATSLSSPRIFLFFCMSRIWPHGSENTAQAFSWPLSVASQGDYKTWTAREGPAWQDWITSNITTRSSLTAPTEHLQEASIPLNPDTKGWELILG